MKKIIALILCLTMLLSLAACTQEPAVTTAPPTEAPTTAPTEPPAEDIYAAAREALDAMTHITSELVITTITEVAGDQFSEKSVQTLTYKDLETEEAVIVCEEELDFDIHSEDYDPEEAEPVTFREVWYQDNLYIEMDVDNLFRYQGPLDKEAVLARYVPAVLLNAELYGVITSESGDNGTAITFSEPTAPESWALPEEGELVEASGAALVSPEGVITEMNYTITYLYGPSKITKTVQAKPMAEPKTVTAPANPDTYETISYVDAIRLFLKEPAMLYQADSATVSSLESMFCQAAGYMQNISTTVNLHGTKADTKAKIENGVFAMDYTSGESEEYEVEQTFQNGKFVTVENGGLPSTTSGVSWEDIKAYTYGEMLNGMLSMEFWEDVTMTDMGSVLYLEYTLNDNFGNTMQNSICEMLWNDSTFLIALASDYRNEEVNGYLSIDKYTGLPVAAGYYYEGIHTIEGDDYSLTLQYDQSFEAPALGAYKEITDEMPEVAEPENKATPLFYHVTGADGQEMWLLGTIHVGDARTAYLPEEIYDAFAASDALALECDTKAFDEQMEEDDALSDQVSDLYFFSDGTTIESLFAAYEEAEEAEQADETEDAGESGETEDAVEEEDIYAQIVKLMKATGNYNMNMPYAKPYLWSSAIDDFYLRQGYQLHRDQGVEERLYVWAEELDKEIIEVESSMFQLQMLTGFSIDLQMWMLGSSVHSDARESWEGTMELYEMWCAGDEAALREYLSDEEDMTDWTEEEIAEYEEYKPLIDEYNKAMSYDRNDGMLKKAIEYLESGDVVFYAVGLAHLLNDVNGLVDALREAGYTVELVTYGG